MSVTTNIILDPHGEDLLLQFRELVPCLKRIEKLVYN